jgi:hypothetical protein
MIEILIMLGYWGHIAVAFLYAALAVWIFHRHGLSNKQQLFLLLGLSLTSVWGFVVSMMGVNNLFAYLAESVRNLGWLIFLYFLLRSGDGREQPKSFILYFPYVICCWRSCCGA